MKISNGVKRLCVLGIDPGTATTGWAILEKEKEGIILKAFGCIQTKKTTPEEERLFEISRDVEKIIKKYSPCEAAIEDIFFFKNLKTVIKVSQARGVLLLSLARNKIKTAEYTPLQVKQALTGYGRADKKQIQLMVKNLLKLSKIPQPDDAADAIAIGICHINSRKLKNIKKV